MGEGVDAFDVWDSGVDRRPDFAFGQAAGGGHGSWLKLTTAGKRSRWQDRYKGRGVPVTAYISGLGATCTIYVTLFGLETIRKLRLNVPMLSITPFFCKSLGFACRAAPDAKILYLISILNGITRSKPPLAIPRS